MVKPKLLDIIVFLIALLAVGFTALNVYTGSSKKPYIYIKSSSQEWILPLDEPDIFTIAGPLGETHVEIADGSVRITDSPCAEKICIKSGAISKQGQWIACLPNKVFITIKGKKGDEIDACSF